MHKISFVFWNLENLFNPETGGPRGDFIPEFGWTWDAFEQKLNRIGEVIQNIRSKQQIDLMGICEVDDHLVIRKLMDKCFSQGYSYVGAEDFKTNNLDTALIYRNDLFEIIRCNTLHVLDRFPKGDVFIVDLMEINTREKFTVIINHWCSRHNGREFSRPFRCTTAENLQAYLWRKYLEDQDFKAIVAGDFNDHPYSTSMIEHLGASYDLDAVLQQQDEKNTILYNSSWEALHQPNPGSLYFSRSRESSWSLFDQVILTRGLLTASGWTYVDGTFTIHRDGMSDEFGRPVPCYYRNEDRVGVLQDGVSDHFPVSIELDFITNESNEG